MWCSTSAASPTLRVEPFLHLGPARIFNPLRDLSITSDEAGFIELLALTTGALSIESLPLKVFEVFRDAGWIVHDDAHLDRRSRIKYVSLEASSACNQSCYFCPVAESPRPATSMPTALYGEIVAQLGALRDTVEGVFMIGYNEPTLDPRFVDQVRTIKAAGLPVAVLSNGTGLTPQRADQLIGAGGLRYLSINLSTLDPVAYVRDRGADHLGVVLRNLDHLKDRPLAQEMVIVVLGTGDDEHARNLAAIERRFAGSRFVVKSFDAMDRAGRLPVGRRPSEPHRCLRGCDQMGSRPLQHLHITSEGKCVLCCEDYDERYVVGDLTRQTVAEVLGGPEIARLRRWIYGLEAGPDDLICRRCIFAVH